MLTYIGRAHAWGLEDLREGTVYDPVSLIGALDEIAYTAMCSREPPPVLTIDMASALVLAKLLEKDMPGLRSRRGEEPMTVIMYNGVKIKWSSAR